MLADSGSSANTPTTRDAGSGAPSVANELPEADQVLDAWQLDFECDRNFSDNGVEKATTALELGYGTAWNGLSFDPNDGRLFEDPEATDLVRANGSGSSVSFSLSGVPPDPTARVGCYNIGGQSHDEPSHEDSLLRDHWWMDRTADETVSREVVARLSGLPSGRYAVVLVTNESPHDPPRAWNAVIQGLQIDVPHMPNAGRQANQRIVSNLSVTEDELTMRWLMPDGNDASPAGLVVMRVSAMR
jgi:hypothetical protein